MPMGTPTTTEPQPGSQPLSEDERAELERYRAGNNAQVASTTEPEEPKPQYWLHLANGDVIESTGQMTHYKGIQVIGCYPITEEEA